jgi:hypothetical protein
MSALIVVAVMVGSVPLALPLFGYIVGIHLGIAYSNRDGADAPVQSTDEQ